MWTSVGFVFAVFLFLGAHVHGKPQEFKWKRNVRESGKPLIVEESAMLFENNIIVMMSADYMLGEAETLRSVSYHDFDNKVLAIRNLDGDKDVNVCLLTTPKTDYDTTLAAIKKRAGGVLEAVPVKNYRVIPTDVKMSGSKMIDTKFCKDAVMYKLVPIVDITKDLIDIGRTLCIWNPLEYGWPKAVDFKGW